MTASPSDASRPYAIVLFGATGFTGGLTAEALARRLTPGTRWAIAGRNREKLTAVAAGLPMGFPVPELLEADTGRPETLRALAEATRVVATTVGPYVLHGEPLVRACAEAGTHYADLTGEPEFVDRMYVLHHATAQRTGARLVHCCGFDSIPHDLGAWHAVQQLGAAATAAVDVLGVVRAGGGFSGGTFHSAMLAFSRPAENREAARARRAIEPRPADGRTVRSLPVTPGYQRAVGGWILPLPTIDPQIVRRSAAALPQAGYGHDFRYGHVVRLPGPLAMVGLTAGVGALAAAAQVGPLRRAILAKKPVGEGPSDQQRLRGWFTVTFHAKDRTSGRQGVTRVAGGDPGYNETARMLAETALSLAFDALPPGAGQQTPAQAMGGALVRRLEDVGIRFEVLKAASSS